MKPIAMLLITGGILTGHPGVLATTERGVRPYESADFRVPVSRIKIWPADRRAGMMTERNNRTPAAQRLQITPIKANPP